MEKIKKITPKERNAIIDSLKIGIVPKIGLLHIQVGRGAELKQIKADYELISKGGAKTRFIIGEYGSGKTFFLTLSKLIAHRKNLVVVSANMTTEKLLSSNDGKARKLFAELIASMSTETQPNSGALESIIERWAQEVFGNVEDVTEEYIQKQLSPLKRYTLYYDFAKVLTIYINAFKECDDVKTSYVLKWLRGEYSTKMEARRELGVTGIIDDDNFYDYLKLFAGFVRLAGYSGLIVCIDELAILGRLRSVTRDKNFETILNIINDSSQGTAEYIEFIFGGTPEVLENQHKGMFSYGALKTRLAENEFSSSERRDRSGPVIRLDNLSKEELYSLFKKIRDVFAEYDKEKYLIKDKEIEGVIKFLMDKLGAKSYTTPRESIKTFINLLSQLQNYPDTNISTYLSGIDIQEDKEPLDEELESLDLGE